MKKVFIFFLTVGVLVAAPTTQIIESYGIGCLKYSQSKDPRDNFLKVEEACMECIQMLPTPGIDRTNENIKIMVSKCVEEYKAEYNKEQKK